MTKFLFSCKLIIAFFFKKLFILIREYIYLTHMFDFRSNFIRSDRSEIIGFQSSISDFRKN
jgi:hypothetical protein